MLSDKIKKVVLLLLLTLAIAVVQGQQPNLTEEDVIAQAQAFFDQEKWEDALPLYAQLVSVYPEKPEYNYKFGVCTLMGNRADKRRPVRYLTIAYRSMADNADLLYYLGLAYYQNEEFANAMKYFNLYLAKLDANSPERATILEQVNACLNGMNLEHKNLVNEVLSKSEFQSDNFHRAYRADELEGDLIIKPENFMTSKEKSSGENSFVYVSEPRGTLYYSGYADNNSNQRDIFKVILKDNGKWGDPERLSDRVNTAFDEAYPVVSEEGSALYFSSKGHNSLGGYDIFKSKLDPVTNEFGTPENMGKGINSPFDDILFIPDNSGSGAFFSSNRDNLGDNISVYRIRLNNEGFADQQILAQQSIQTKIEGAVGNEAASSSTSANDPAKENRQLAANKPAVDPQKKAADLVNQKAYADRLADTAYLMVSNMKSLIRDLSNKRDRANMISNNKMDKAKSLEAEYENIISGLPKTGTKEEFEAELAKAVKLKEEIYQYRQRADQANLIAWNIGKHIKLKDQELNQLKLDAGEVQSLSVKGDFDQTQMVYSRLRSAYFAADTLTDYAANINWINTDKVDFEIPDSELAFATKMREGYDNKTLLALTQAQQGAVAKFNESVPINVVDNRTAAAPPEVPAVVVIAQVEQVAYTSSGEPADLAMDDQLEISFDVDAIEPYPLVSPVEMTLMAQSDLMMDEETPEINFSIDAIEALQVVEPVNFSETAFASVDEEELELNFNVDTVEPELQVQPVLMDEAAYAYTIEEDELEINNRADWVEAEKVIQPVIVDANDYAMILEDDVLEINDRADWVEAEKVIQPVSFDEPALVINVDDEALELSNFNDRVEAAAVATQIAFAENDQAGMIEEEDLEIRIETPAVEPAVQVEQVSFATSDFELENEDLEIQHTIDAIVPVTQVEQIAFNIPAEMEMDEAELEINTNIDVRVHELVDLVAFEETATTSWLDEEPLEISFTSDLAKVLKQAQPVELSQTGVLDISDEELEIHEDVQPSIQAEPLVSPVMMAATTTGNAVPEEELEINLEADVVEPAQVVEQVQYAQNNPSLTSGDEELEIRLETEAAVLLPQIAQVETAELEARDLELLEEELDVTFDVDAVEAYALVEPVDASAEEASINEDLEIRIEADPRPEVHVFDLVQAVDYAPAALAMEQRDEVLELDFTIDKPEFVEPFKQVDPVRYSLVAYSQDDVDELLEISFSIDAQAQDKLMADNAELSNKDLIGVQGMPAAGTELFYLRESVSMAADIETSRTDIEIVRIAIENPDDLSYEELLFAASLAPVPEDKLRIYNYAFIHIDRDWRAFNNAAVTAMNMKDLDQAEVYLYQASLISSENGKVENNMGILACYKNDFVSAESHFITASELGVNSEYNLQLVKNLVNNSRGNNN